MGKNVLVLCHGNINRSPSCAAVLATLLGEDRVKSAGFKMSARRAAKKSRTFMRSRGYDLEDHVPQPISQELVAWAHVIVYMDGGNKKRLDEFLLWECNLDKTPTLVNLAHFLQPPGSKIKDPAFISYAEDGILNEIYDGIVQASIALATEKDLLSV